MPQKRKMPPLKWVAYHEAGHAVIGRVLGMTCGGATIEPNYIELTAGHAIAYVERSIEDWDCRGRWRWKSMFRARIMMLMAGRESEIECFGKDPHSTFGDGDDLREIAMTISEADIPDEVQLVKLRNKTRSLVHRHRNSINQVAAALLDRRSLDAAQIDGILVRRGVRLPARIADPAAVSFEEKYSRHHTWATGKRIVAKLSE